MTCMFEKTILLRYIKITRSSNYMCDNIWNIPRKYHRLIYMLMLLIVSRAVSSSSLSLLLSS